MNKRRCFTFVALIVATAASLIVGTSFFTQSLLGQTNTKLLVSAAASLKDSLQEIKPLYQNKQQVAIAYNFAASGALQQQIENGAPVDIFISAAEKQSSSLVHQQLHQECNQDP